MILHTNRSIVPDLCPRFRGEVKLLFNFNRFLTIFTLFLCNVFLFFVGCDEEQAGNIISQIEQPTETPDYFSEDE